MHLSALDCPHCSRSGGGLWPTRLVKRAAELGYSAIALVDENGVWGCGSAAMQGEIAA